MKIICIVNQKSGLGKATITLNLSYGIAVKGYKVLLVDTEPHGSVKQRQGLAGDRLQRTGRRR
ncbi:MAG: AAA family ATPase [Syntrophaceae bacterium]